MKYKMEPYAYFQPADILFLINGERAELSSAGSSAASGSQGPGASQAGSETTASSGVLSSDFEAPQNLANKASQGFNDLTFDDKVKVVIDWTKSVAEDLGLNVTIEANRQRDIYFAGISNGPIYEAGVKGAALETKKLQAEADIQQVVSASDQGYTSPIINARSAFSLIVAEVKKNLQPGENNPDQYVEHKDLARLIAELDDKRGVEKLTTNGIDLGVVTPNWLSAPASEWGGGGGPGSRPAPYKGRSDSARYEFVLPEELEKLCSTNKATRGTGVKVVILDTAPSMHELVWAYERYHKVNPQNRVAYHPLIERLLNPSGPFHLHPASREDLFRMRAVHLRDHNYNMTAHGLFVAGIIHSIAPAAEIHLYEVLNSEGVGDLLTIYNALAKIADEFRGQRYVVNCSLTLTVPFQGNPNLPDAATQVPSTNLKPIVGHRLTDMCPAFLKKIADDPNWVVRTCSWIESVCDAIYLSNARVVAAAGNDRKSEDPGRPEARALASFGSVQGVGALPREQPATARMPNGKYAVSSYSDLSDIPSSVGITTLGGEPGEGNGVLGVYVGEFPPPVTLSFWQWVAKIIVELLGGTYTGAPKNESDWAWWAGTSFATPILTGCIAAVMSNSTALTSTEAAIKKMYDSFAIKDGGTDYDEDLMDVTQG